MYGRFSSQPFHGGHFAVMPLELAEKCIKAGSRPGDTVLDMFAGVGTTGVAARGLGRSAVLIELSAEYADIAKKRLSLGTGLTSSSMVIRFGR